MKYGEDALYLFGAKHFTFDRQRFNTYVKTVPLNRVDLAVVRNRSKGLCESPLRKRVCREPLVKKGERDFEVWILEVFIELLYMGRHHKPFVREQLRTHRRDVKVVILLECVLNLFTAKIQQCVKTFSRHYRVGRYKNLNDIGESRKSLIPECIGIYRYVAL